ncbi:MAG TPA: MYXO-CTERM sorting domain-containing protein [Labilithrix sp.]|nr:MYXO-CTERM sorting domain-containing protein [Labilithrix sp.]
MRHHSISPAFRRAVFALLAAVATLIGFPRAAHAVGTFKLKSTEANEVSGAWHLYVTIELPKPPLVAHQSMKFLFTKTMVYERSLIDGHNEPVVSRQPLQNQTPTVESLDVDFADPSGKIYKGTRFDFGLTRARGYEAGEYKVEVRTSDGTRIGAPATLILKGDNPVVDRRAMAFSAKEKGVKKIEAYDAGANQAKNDEPVPVNPNTQGEVTPTGTATGFVPPEGMEETEEEKIKVRPKGCGCEVPGPAGPGTAFLFFLPILGVGLVAARRRASNRKAA